MRHARVLARYAVASVGILAASIVALAPLVRDRAAGPSEERPSVRAELSTTARLAYWREGEGRLELWAGDLDGRRKWTIATEDQHSEVSLTTWSPDGRSVAYVLGRAALGVAHVDGTPLVMTSLAQPFLGEGWKIVSLAWSPDSTRVAATVRAGNGVGNDSDVYLMDAAGGVPWRRVTSIGDAFVCEWVDDSRLLVETGSGMIGVVDIATSEVRPISGMAAASPLIGLDGRVHFAGGRFARADVSARPYANGAIWSSTIDGDDVRRESVTGIDQMRLFGVLADGRAVVGVPGGVYLVRDDRVVLSFRSGTVRSIQMSSDRRHLVGWTGSRLLLIDAARIGGPSGALAPDDAATVLLEGVADAQVWYPPVPRRLAHAASRSSGPPARLAFALGRAVWQTDADGTPHLLTTGQQYYVSPPRWSPSGDRLALVVTTGAPARATAIVAGPHGTFRWEAPGVFPVVQWTPDGRLAFAVGGGVADRGAGPQLVGWATEIHDADSGQLVDRMPGRVRWAGDARIRLTDGDVSPSRALVGQAVEVLAAEGARRLTDAGRLAAELLTAGDAFEPTITSVDAFGDPAYVGVSVWKLANGRMTEGAFAVVRVADGRTIWSLPISYIAAITRSDVSASSVGRLVAWTEGARYDYSLNVDPPPTSVFVADPATGRVTRVGAGRFAGWSPDPGWIYVARDEGLFAVRVDGSAEVRVSPIGVSVVATKP